MEDIVVELAIPTGVAPGENVQSKRFVQVTTGAGTTVIDGVTYTRTSPLRTTKSHGGQGIQLPVAADGNAWESPVGAAPSVGNVLLAIFSQSGT